MPVLPRHGDRTKKAPEPDLQREKTGDVSRQLATEINALISLGKNTSLAASPSQMADAALGTIIDVVQPDFGILYQRSGNVLNSLGIKSNRDDIKMPDMEQLKAGECLCGLAGNGVAVFSENIHTDNRCTKNTCKAAGFHSFAAMPLVQDAGVIGVLAIASKATRNFSLQAPFLEALSHQAAIGLNNCLLYAKVKSRAAELEKQVKALTRDRKARKKMAVAFGDKDAKQLCGMLPICSSCKKIRDSAASWHQIEKYICDRSDAQFSHSLCPDCSKVIYPGLEYPDVF
ncbi:MAG: GAF domain-containing protein [Desulfobacteraceae bacterium]|nr:GAF domain-containing protein [Desulfobacteraceae bacterium]